MSWLARLKKSGSAQGQDATETTKRVSVVSVAPMPEPFQKSGSDPGAANDPALPDRWTWPHSEAMSGAEISDFTARLARFTDKGMNLEDAERLADKLVMRDRDSDDRRLCMECSHLTGHARGAWGCGNWQRAGVAIRARDTQLPSELVQRLQRCDGFNDQHHQGGSDGSVEQK